jgi:D-arabinose 1-dehydrogenase-like Zn-dependent alcohol dehydrogenase
MELVDAGNIKPVIYKEHYRGLEDVPRALEDLKAHKAWGRAIVRINEAAENEHKARL